MKIVQNKVLMERYVEKIRKSNLISPSFFSEMKLAVYKKNEFIYHQEEVLNNIYILVDGSIRVSYATSNGKETTFRILKQPRIVGEIELILDSPALSSVEALDTTYCFLLSLSRSRNTLLNDVVFLKHVSYNLADALTVSNNLSSINQNFSPKSRVVSYILSTRKETSFQFDYKVVASIIGTSERHVFRIISGLIQDGIIEKQKHGFRIIALDSLADLAGDSYII